VLPHVGDALLDSPNGVLFAAPRQARHVFASWVISSGGGDAVWRFRTEISFPFAPYRPGNASGPVCGFGMCNASTFHSNFGNEIILTWQHNHLLAGCHLKIIQISLSHNTPAADIRCPVFSQAELYQQVEHRPEQNATLFDTTWPARSKPAWQPKAHEETA
jgi:hypothetical protein